MARVVGLYPGTFDPPTNGHFDIILRGARVVEELVVGVAINAGKGPLFGIDDRVAMVEEWIAGLEDRDLANRITVQHDGRPAGSLRQRCRRQCHRPWPPRRVGLRLRIPDDGHEQPPR